MQAQQQPTMPGATYQPTVRSATYQPQAALVARPIPAPPRPMQETVRHPVRQSAPRRKSSKKWLWAIPVMSFVFVLSCIGAIGLAGALIYGNGILPGVSIMGESLAGLSEKEAVTLLESNWQTLTLRDDNRIWRVNPAEMGIALNATKTAALAYAQGRGTGSPLRAIFGGVDIQPVIGVNQDVLRSELAAMSDSFAVAAVNAGVEFVNGEVRATDAKTGRMINIDATVAALDTNPAEALSDGMLRLVMNDVAPIVADSSALVAQAQMLLSRPLDIRVFDPVTGDSIYWSLMPDDWAQWLTATPDANSAIGLSLQADDSQVRDYLMRQAANTFDSTRSIDVEAGVASIRDALAAGQPGNAYVTVQHGNRTHTVQSGESITSIAWDYGVPYLYIQNANNGLNSVSIGQQIIIPPADEFLIVPPIADKRIVVSISQQKTWVYENGALKWEWVSSTGIADSPTWTGVYQIISHVPNAYAGNWNLNMPWFMGVYQPIPNADFTNGFHGFPTRGGGQLLWENSLGRRVTYGCILLSNTNVQQLYEWAEEGVVVEIQA
ncbi:MAG: L,D-transpeptidase family protein [Aggregatilineales bacterium]